MIETISNSMLRRLDLIEQQIGNTPLMEIEFLRPGNKVRLFAKWEWAQWSGSVKARSAFAMIRDGIRRGLLDEKTHLLDATSGNTGIAYAQISTALGLPVSLVIPENASAERKRMLKWHGAHLIYSPPTGRTDEAQDIARELADQNPEKYHYIDQYNNPSNPETHRRTTSREIFEQTGGAITHFISGLGTTGTFTGVSSGLKERNPSIRCIALQPDSPMHGLEGWKHLESARVPGIFKPGLIDDKLEINTEEAYHIMREAAVREGLFLSPSSAANLAGAIKLAEQLEEGVIVTVFPDAADRYGEVIEQLLK